RLRSLPLGIVVERENPLNPLGPAAAPVVEHFERVADLFQAGIFFNAGGSRPAADAIKDGRHIQDLAARFKEKGVESRGSGERRHGSRFFAVGALTHGFASLNSRLVSRLTRSFRLPER